MSPVDIGVAIGIATIVAVGIIAIFGYVAYTVIGIGADMLRRMRENRR